MKSILVTYDVAVHGNKVWERGEAAFRLEFVDDDVAGLLQKLVGTPVSQMSDYEHYIWNKLDMVIDSMEMLRDRYYLNNSIKSIIIGGDT